MQRCSWRPPQCRIGAASSIFDCTSVVLPILCCQSVGSAIAVAAAGNCAYLGVHGRPGKKPFHRPRPALRQRRRERRRRRSAHGGRALSRHGPRPRQERRRTGRGAGRPQRPDHEGGAASRHHPRGAAAGIHHRTDQAAEPGAADGLGLRQAPHAGRAWRRLAEEIRKLRASSRRGGFARAGASRAFARRRGARLQAAIRRHAVGGRSRSPPARPAVRHPAAVRSGDRHHRDDQGDRRADARGARLPPRGQARRALPRHAGGRGRGPRAESRGRSFRPAGC